MSIDDDHCIDSPQKKKGCGMLLCCVYYCPCVRVYMVHVTTT